MAERAAGKPNKTVAVLQDASASDAEFLAAIGAEVRRHRAKRGMTRRQLAQASETSERYLAQIESGAGNPSASVLRAIAGALGLPASALLPETPARPAALGALIDLIAQVPEGELPALTKDIEARIARAGSADRGRRIALVGLRGAGKSTLGRMLAQHLGWPFIELDQLVEEDYGASIPDLIEMAGTATFRRIERGALERVVAAHESAIITTAGGIVADADTYALLLRRTHTIWIKARPEDHMSRVMAQGDFRPMAQNRGAMADLVAILDARRADYARAEAELDTSGETAERSFAKLLQAVTKMLGGDAVAPSPRARGEGKGGLRPPSFKNERDAKHRYDEGASPTRSDIKAQNRGEAPSPSLRSTSPRAAGRGKARP